MVPLRSRQQLQRLRVKEPSLRPIRDNRGYRLLEGYRNEGEVGDRPVSRGKHDQIAAAGDLTGHTLDVVSRCVHKVISPRFLADALGVLEHPLESRGLRLLHRRPEALQRDIVQTAVEIPAGRVRLAAHAVQIRQRLVVRLRRHERLRRFHVRHFVQNVRIGAHQLVRLRQNRASPAVNQVLSDSALQRIRSDSRKRVASAALQRHAERSDRLRRPARFGGNRDSRQNGGTERGFVGLGRL